MHLSQQNCALGACTRGEISSRLSLSYTPMATNADQRKWRQSTYFRGVRWARVSSSCKVSCVLVQSHAFSSTLNRFTFCMRGDESDLVSSRVGSAVRFVSTPELARALFDIDQFQISPAASPALLHNTVWRTFHSLLRWKMIIPSTLTTSPTLFSS